MQAAIAIHPTKCHTPLMSPASETPRAKEIKCTTCNLRETCLPAGLGSDDVTRMQRVVYLRRRVKRGESLFAAGDEFRALYAIRSGFFKSSVVDGEGREQVTGFFMGGELLGMDGLGSGQHNGTAIALEDSEVCVMPYSLIEEMSREVPSLQRQLHAVLSREIVRDHGVMMLLGSMRAEARLATFLLNLSRRFVRRGYSPSDFHLRMTREELGSYLGLKLETVSRLFSQFQKGGLIAVDQKHIRILDIKGLEKLLGNG
jgi:CRP/FNR family transcriptional regulator, anaerobic regulatory protein